MIAQFTITSSAWVAISSAGQSGAAWLDEGSELNNDSTDIRIVHSTSGAPPAADLSKGKRVMIPERNGDLLILSADTSLDIFYARAVNDSGLLSVDVV
jgi:hypothetical protein